MLYWKYKENVIYSAHYLHFYGDKSIYYFGCGNGNRVYPMPMACPSDVLRLLYVYFKSRE